MLLCRWLRAALTTADARRALSAGRSTATHARAALATFTLHLAPLAHLGVKRIELGPLLRRQDRPHLGLHGLRELLALCPGLLLRCASLVAMRAGGRGVTTLARGGRGLKVGADSHVELLKLSAVPLVNSLHLRPLGFGETEFLRHPAHVGATSVLATHVALALRVLGLLRLRRAGGKGQCHGHRSDTEDSHCSVPQMCFSADTPSAGAH